jgi:predicted Zn-dependent protease
VTTISAAPRVSSGKARRAQAAAAAIAALATALAPVTAAAQGGPPPKGVILRDAETEQLLRDYTAPIFRAAGVDAKATQIVLINDQSFNAFVANGRKIFVNLGALMESETPNEIIGVLAHETGHIAGGHLARLRDQIANAQVLSVAGMLLGGAAIAGAVKAGDKVGNAGTGAAGAMMGGQEMIRRSLLSYQRAEEQTADQSAVRYLKATGQSPKGLLTTFRRFADMGMFRSQAVDPYLISHPLPAERISQLETLAKASPHFEVKDPPALQARHDMVRAKIYGFVARADTVLRRYPPHNASAPARYARAVLAYRSGRLQEALSLMDGLIKEQPGNPYFQEVKGQALLESGRAREAIGPLRRAVAASPGAVPIRAMLGHALVATSDPKLLDEAIRELLNVTQRDPDMAEPFEHLATAYGRKGDVAMAELASAQAFINAGDWKMGHTQASRAMAKLKPGSPAYLKAEDIMNARPPGKI